jgi:hypothetical protein
MLSLFVKMIAALTFFNGRVMFASDFPLLHCMLFLVSDHVLSGIDSPHVKFECAGVAVVHVLQALLYLCFARARGFFTRGALIYFVGGSLLEFIFLNVDIPGKFLFNCLLPVIGWSVWCCSKQPASQSESISLDTPKRANFVTTRVEMMDVSGLMCSLAPILVY